MPDTALFGMAVAILARRFQRKAPFVCVPQLVGPVRESHRIGSRGVLTRSELLGSWRPETKVNFACGAQWQRSRHVDWLRRPIKQLPAGNEEIAAGQGRQFF